MKKIFNKIYRIFAAWSQPKYNVLYCDDLPSKADAFKVYLVGEKDDPWQAAFLCPCGCNAFIQLSLLKDSRPCWRVLFDKKNNISLYPSINRQVGCKSHFYLSSGKIDWARDYRYSK